MISFFFNDVRKAAPRRRRPPGFRAHEAQALQAAVGMRIDLVRGIKAFKKRIPLSQLTEALRSGNLTDLYRVVPWDRLPGDLEKAVAAVRRSAHRSSELQIARLPPHLNKNLRFDPSNPRMRGYLQTKTADLVGGIEESARQNIRNVIQRGFQVARPPQQVAEQLRASIGLLPNHEIAVENYRLRLYADGIPEARADDLADQYTDRLLDYRANMIARTETRNATNTGQLDVWKEAGNQGLLDRATTTKEWVVDGEPCEECQAMDGLRVPIDEPWIFENHDGTTSELMVPSESHPNCMCGMEVHFEDTEDAVEESED